MVQTYSETVTIRGGATPATFDGAGTLTFNDKAKKLVGMKITHSASVITVDEALGICLRLQSSNWNGSRYFFAGMIAHGATSANLAPNSAALDVIALDIDVGPNTSLQVDVTSVLGATQTGTHDVNIEFVYADGPLPADQQAVWNAVSGNVAAKGGSYAYLAALTTTDRTAMTLNATLLNIPEEAKEIIAVVAEVGLDTAVTVSEEIGATIEVDYGISTQGKQEYATNGGMPELGTDVSGSSPTKVIRSPILLPDLPKRELQVRAFVTALSAITGGADYALNILWR